ncbi:hypothetical protein C2759_02405 [Polynucleobacter sp. MG-Unter2-18]|uniref:hypothetical protein n=1 Tax=Polynucleobacter sp. MG-Unter2-18 TaxID=2081052 RepID=UPI001BFE0F72|nr:hypothetical protein [Polynucleobacter sp. MG-Unter2-18]QWD95007.1 hypothetical protein C2759_02405 [Polynucleobacter sp. MG-Unter2-18]
MTKGTRFIIVAPPYNELSAGVKVLHFLCHSLNQAGVNSSMLFLDLRDRSYNSFMSTTDKTAFHESYNTPVITSLEEIDFASDIVVYPDIIRGNPLNSKKVVRYMLNKNGLITGNPIIYDSNDFIVSYQKIFEPNAHFNLFLTDDDLTLIPSRDSIQKLNKNISLTYVGKGGKYGDTVRIGGTISLDWKKSHEEYILLLENAKYLFTWDQMTGVVFDAIIHGCIPVIVSKNPWTFDEINAQELSMPYLTLEEFDNKEKYFDDYVLFLNFRDKIIEDSRLLQSTSRIRVEEFISKSITFFDKKIILGIKTN